MARLTGTEITVRPSSRTQRALRDSMKGLSERLLAVCDADELGEDLQKQLALVMEIFNGRGEGPPPGKRATRKKGPSDTMLTLSTLRQAVLHAAGLPRGGLPVHARLEQELLEEAVAPQRPAGDPLPLGGQAHVPGNHLGEPGGRQARQRLGDARLGVAQQARYVHVVAGAALGADAQDGLQVALRGFRGTVSVKR